MFRNKGKIRKISHALVWTHRLASTTSSAQSPDAGRSSMDLGTAQLPEPGRYRAFISYSHADGPWGDWLHRALEGYRVPRMLVGQPSRAGPIPRRLYPIFRDREELPAAVSLGEQIEQALIQSAYLIVICSPRSAGSRWVNEEILRFKRLGRADRILALIIDGEPHASDVVGREDSECFPPALRFELSAEGDLGRVRTEPIAADARPGKDGKHKARLKLIAGLLGIGFDKLAQRERQRQRQWRLIAAVAACLTIIAGGFAGREVVEARRQARLEAARAYFAEAQRFMAAEASYWNGVERLARAVQHGLPGNHPGLARAVRGVVERRRDWTRLHTGPAPLHDGLPGTTYELGAPRTPLISRADEGEIMAAAFSATGDRGMTFSSDGTLRVWDVDSGEQVLRPMPYGESVSKVAFSSSGRKVATVHDEGKGGATTVMVWEPITGARIAPPLAHEGAIYLITFSPDNEARWIAAMSYDNTVSVWNSSTGKLVSRPLEKVVDGERGAYPEDDFASVAMSPDGRWVAAGSVQGWIGVWDASTGKFLAGFAQDERDDEVIGPTRALAFSPDGRWLASGSDSVSGRNRIRRDGIARVWDLTSGQLMSSPVRASDTVWSITFSPDGSRLAIADAETVRLLDPFDLAPPPPPMVLESGLAKVAFSPDGRWLMAFNSTSVRVWSATGTPPPPERGPGGEHVAFDPRDLGMRSSIGKSSDRVERPYDPETDLPSAMVELGPLLSMLVTCVDAPAGGQHPCRPAEPDKATTDLLLSRLESAQLRSWLRYHVLGDPAGHPLLLDSPFAGQPLQLRERVVEDERWLLRDWWENTGYLSLGSASVLAEMSGGVSSFVALPQTLLLLRDLEQMIEDAGKPEFEGAVYVPRSEEVEVARADLRLARARLAEYGYLRLGAVRHPLWTAAENLAIKAELDAVQLPASIHCEAVDCSLRYLARYDVDQSGAPVKGGPPSTAQHTPIPGIVELRRAAGTDPPDVAAIHHLADMLETGFGIDRDLVEAHALRQRSAELGHADAQYALAVRIELGAYDDTDGDPAGAMRWYAAAAGQGHARAAYRLGQMYEEGLGDRADAANAAGWYRLAALRGHAAAHYTLARVLLHAPSLATRNLELVDAALNHLRDSPAKESGDRHELRWLAGEAQLLARSLPGRLHVDGIAWRWPAQGELIQRFIGSDPARRHVAIAGREGQAVVAAADGVVVYSGAGLRGYGELIIISHSSEFLSAYGHNRKRLVAEGAKVRAGQVIAEMGSTGTNRNTLHFEIRRGGHAVDPLQFLSPR